MPQKTYTTKDEVPESLRAAAHELKDGKFVVFEDEDVAGLKSAHRTALDEKKKLEDKLAAALGDLKLDDVAEMAKRQKKLEEEQARKAGDFDKILEKRLGERDVEWQKKYDAVAPFKDKYENTTIEATIRKAALAGGVDPKDLEEYVIPLVKGRRIKLDESGKPLVLDKDGDPTGLTVEKFFAESFKAEAPKFYAAAGGSGGGSGGGSSSSNSAMGGVKITDDKTFTANLERVAKGEMKVAR